MKNKVLFSGVLIVFLVASVACGRVSIAIETPVQESASPQGGIPDIVVTEESQGISDPGEATPEPTEVATPEETPAMDASRYWVTVQDPQYGVRFAVPCFWEVNFPPDYHMETGSGISYAVRNYTDEYALSFPRGEGVFENGGIKIDMSYMHGPFWGAAPGTSMLDFVVGLYVNDTETRLVSTQEATINGQPALLVTTESIFGLGQFYLFTVSDEVYLLFATRVEAMQDTEVQAILNSIAILPETAVQVPGIPPASPPGGIEAPCLAGAAPSPEQAEDTGQLACPAVAGSPEDLACTIRDGLRSNNLSALLGYMADPFIIGYWGSEGRTDSPQGILDELRNYLLPVDTSSLTFTSERSLFPPLYGIPPEGMFGPDVNVALIVYSEGWGSDGMDAVLIYIAQNEAGGYYWHGMVYSGGHFDKNDQTRP